MTSGKMDDTRVVDYVMAALSNPKWLEYLAKRYGDGATVGVESLAAATAKLEYELCAQLGVRHPTSEPVQAEPSGRYPVTSGTLLG